MSKAEAEPDGGSLSIPSADGYHYADDHPWDSSDQEALTDDLWDTVEHFRDVTVAKQRLEGGASRSSRGVPCLTCRGVAGGLTASDGAGAGGTARQRRCPPRRSPAR